MQQNETELNLKQKLSIVAVLCLLCSLPILWVLKERATKEAEYQKAQAALRIEQNKLARAKAKLAKPAPKKQTKGKKKMATIAVGTTGQANLRGDIENPSCLGGVFEGGAGWQVKTNSDVEVARVVNEVYSGDPDWDVTGNGSVSVPSSAALGIYRARVTDGTYCGEDGTLTYEYDFKVVGPDEATALPQITPTSFCPGDVMQLYTLHPHYVPSVSFFAESDTEFTTELATAALSTNPTPDPFYEEWEYAYLFTAPVLAVGNYLARVLTEGGESPETANVVVTRLAECPGDPPPPETGLKVVLHRWV